MLLNEIQQEQFRRAYAVMYENEETLQEAMQKFNPGRNIIPNIKKDPSYRRGLVNRLITGNRDKYRDPYHPTDTAFHFEDIKYFLGDTPIVVVAYGAYSLNEFMKKFSDTERFAKYYDTGNLAMTALQNVGVEVNKSIFLRWDDTYGSEIKYVGSIDNTGLAHSQLPEKTATSVTPETESLETSVINPKDEIKFDKNLPLLILENYIGWGEKHKEIDRLLSRQDLGIDNRTLVFSFVGKRAGYQSNVSPYDKMGIKNELRLM